MINPIWNAKPFIGEKYYYVLYLAFECKGLICDLSDMMRIEIQIFLRVHTEHGL